LGTVLHSMVSATASGCKRVIGVKSENFRRIVFAS
jgi:hypothetical protein